MTHEPTGRPGEQSWQPADDWTPDELAATRAVPETDGVAVSPSEPLLPPFKPFPDFEPFPTAPERVLAPPQPAPGTDEERASEEGALPPILPYDRRGSWSTSRTTAVVVIIGVLIALGIGLTLLLGVRSMLVKQAELTSGSPMLVETRG